ncbi:methyltransferase domain-containing protein [Microcoleus sp. BROC3]|uniref:methyltransferase domain-containing protein n=1 Tax=Microcoleus sp. BROC3 TaxID=3055323 RepID=UPI002FD3892E
MSVGGDARLGQLAWENLTVSAETKVLDRCCGSGQTKPFMVQYSQDVTGLDASPLSLQGARKNVPSANYYLEAFAESMPFPDCQFDTSTQQRCDARSATGAIATIFQEVYRAVKSGGLFILVDFHRHTNPVFLPGLAVFLWLFETETELGSLLAEVGWRSYNSEEAQQPKIYAGGSIQVIQVQKSVDSCQLTVDSCH